ncbi:MAG: tetratricopeptide repeat protein [Bryobacterales bacterium]
MQFAYASILERAKRFDEAEAKFRSLLDRDPENAGALNYLGYMLADRNVKLDEAHDMVQKALDLEPENGAYLDSLGWVYYRQDKLRLAERYLTRSLEQYGRDPVVHTHLGDVYFKMGDNEQARKHWEKSLEEWRKSAVADQDRTEMAKLEQKLEKLGVKVSKADEDAKKSKQ